LTYEVLPANIRVIDDHWVNCILPNSTMFVGKTPNGNPSFQVPKAMDHSWKTEECRDVPDDEQTEIKAGIYQPSEPHKKLPFKSDGNVSFNEYINYKPIPPRGDIDNHWYQFDQDAVNKTGLFGDMGQAISTVPPLHIRMKYAANPNAFTLPVSINTNPTPLKHW
jgi:hypothetical protein